MKRALYIAGPIGLALTVVGAGWAVLAPHALPSAYRITFAAGLVLGAIGAWGRRDALFGSGGVRKARLGAGALATVGVSLALLLLVNFAAARYPQRWDITRNRDFSLHPATLRALSAVEREVEVYAFVPASEKGETRAARELYELFAFHQPKLRVTVADPNQRPDLLEKVQQRGSKMTVVVAGDRQTIFPGHAEADLAAALLEVGREAPRVVYWVQGHGERTVEAAAGTGYVQFEKELRNAYMQVRMLTLGQGEQVPADASLLVFNDPRKPIPEAEAKLYDDWLRRGNRALVLQDVDLDQAAGEPAPAASLLDRWGLRAVPAVVLDPRARTGEADPRMVVGDMFGRHPAVQSLIGSLAIFPLARPLEFFQVTQDQQIFHHALAWVGADRDGAGNDPYGATDLAPLKDGAVITPEARAAWSGRPLNLVLAAFRRFVPREGDPGAGREARVVLLGDADFINDGNIARESNRELALNLVRWTTGEELLIRREGETRTAKTAMAIEPNQFTLVQLLVYILPSIAFLAGWIVWGVRRTK